MSVQIHMINLLNLLFLLIHVIDLEPDNTNRAEISEPYFGVEYELGSVRGINSTYNPLNGDIYLYRNDLVRISVDAKIDTLAYGLFGEGEIFEMDTHPDGDRVRFWDRGVGRVFDFYLNEKKLERIDQSHSHNNMFGHAAYVDSEGGIFAMGGYGYWQLKNLLVRYEPDLKQWEQVIVTNREQVPEARNGKLFADNEFLYYLIENTHRNSKRLDLFKLDNNINVWNKDKNGSYLLQSHFKIPGSTFRYNSTYSIDKENSIVALISENNRTSIIIFYDLTRQKRYIFNAEQHGIYSPRAVFYSEMLKKWVVLSHGINRQDRTRLNVKTIESAFILDNIIPETAPFWVARPFFYGTASMIFLLLLLLSIYKVSSETDKRFNKATSNEDKGGIKIIYKNHEPIHVIISGKKVDLEADLTVYKFWAFILNAAQASRNQILLADFDEKVFENMAESSQRSRDRSRLFERVNKEVQKPFIYTMKSEYDKRVKVVEIDYSRLDIKKY